MKMEDITKSISKKLGKEESGKIADDIANLLSLESSRLQDIQNKEEEITKLKSDKEMLITANGNLLQKINVQEEEILSPKKEEKQEYKPFDFREALDEKGRFRK